VAYWTVDVSFRYNCLEYITHPSVVNIVGGTDGEVAGGASLHRSSDRRGSEAERRGHEYGDFGESVHLGRYFEE
jgi:hypothetical protein